MPSSARQRIPDNRSAVLSQSKTDNANKTHIFLHLCSPCMMRSAVVVALLVMVAMSLQLTAAQEDLKYFEREVSA